MKSEAMADFKFIRPLEAPIFTPTEEEFKDPLAYLNKIRPQAERAGICKIKPPSCWQPPFAVDVDCFKFTPRIQRLNELEAKTRIKLNFLDQIAKFWELQGSSLKIPIIEKKALDLYSLHKLIQSDGGHDKVNNEKKWNRIATRMGYCATKNYGPLLKSHYDKILYPFDLFQNNKLQNTNSDNDKNNEKEKDLPGTPTKKGSPMKSKPSPVKSKCSPTKMGNKMKSPDPDDDAGGTGIDESIEPTSKELRRLAFYGAGPKMAGFNSKSSQNLQLKQDLLGRKTKTPSMHDPLSKYICLRCKKGNAEHCMLLCDGCDDSYHTFCLLPPLPEVPKGEWRCPQCVAEEVSKPSEAFGFEQANREYTLQQFGEMADGFKSEYFNTPVHMVESEVIEREFWRIVSAIDEDVTVEYGADLHTMDHGSGFPTHGSSNIMPGDELYIKSGWNLNNLPVLAGSVLGHINADISGMKVPWMYVGMCFATFCWHNEDHWSYSINYLHWGEPKTWYGVPGCRADDFENAMKQAAPELFQSQPDLLHQLVTIMNPNILMKAGVPVYRMDQRAGEFIVTFPRAYHAGFNQGYNFAEAVNFAPPDWLAMGRSCIEHYSTLHRYCVFAHDELVCKMSTEATDLTLMVAMATYRDMLTMCASEKDLRKAVNNWGVTKCERKAYELLPDDERLCDFCKTTCFLSAITCTCTNRLACVRHYDKLCECPANEHTLMYRYTMDEIPAMMKKLRARTLEYENWVERLEEGVITNSPHDKIDLEDLKELLLEAETKAFPKTPLRDSAIRMVEEAEKCILVAQKLTHPAIKTRTRNTEDSRVKLKLLDLELFIDQMNGLTVKIKEAVHVRHLLEEVKAFKIRAKELLAETDPNIDQLKACLNNGISMEIQLEEVAMLQKCLERTKWLRQVDGTMESERIWTLEYLDKSIEEGEALEKMNIVERRLSQLRKQRQVLVTWETKANRLLADEEYTTMEQYEDLIVEAKNLNLTMPALSTLKNIVKKGKEYAVELNWPYDDCADFSIDYLRNAAANAQLIKQEFLRNDEDEDVDQDGEEACQKRKSTKSSSGPAAKSRRVSSEGNNKKSKKRNKTDSNGGKELEDWSEGCAAKPCKQPSGKEVNWVFCDSCEEWYHLVCVGAKKSVVSKISTYECIYCKANKTAKDVSDDNSVGSCDKGSATSSNKENAESKKLTRSENKNGESDEAVSCDGDETKHLKMKEPDDSTEATESANASKFDIDYSDDIDHEENMKQDVHSIDDKAEIVAQSVHTVPSSNQNDLDNISLSMKTDPTDSRDDLGNIEPPVS